MTGTNVYQAIDTLFYNSQSLFIEFHDIIAMPWFTMLYYIKSSDFINTMFDTEIIQDYTLTGLLEWYLNRKERNVFMNIPTVNGEYLNEEEAESILKMCMDLTDDFYKVDTNLKFMYTLRMLLNESGLVKRYYIYSEREEPGIETIINHYFKEYGTKVQYIHGDFKDAIKNISRDSTYILSDIEKVEVLYENNLLEYASVVIANGLRYNYTAKDKNKLKVDLEELHHSVLFKDNFFDNFDMEDTNSGLIPPELTILNKIDETNNPEEESDEDIDDDELDNDDDYDEDTDEEESDEDDESDDEDDSEEDDEEYDEDDEDKDTDDEEFDEDDESDDEDDLEEDDEEDDYDDPTDVEIEDDVEISEILKSIREELNLSSD